MRSQTEFDEVLGLVEEGRNDTEIFQVTGIPRTTVRDWRRGLGALTIRTGGGSGLACPLGHNFGGLPPREYCYLLGLYLGDGYIARSQRVWKLRITMDERYPGIIEECCGAMERIMLGQTAHILQRQTKCVEVSMYSKHWPCFFPQHGSGRKHERRIELEPWQEMLVGKATECLLRGLIHSDGCRVVTLDRGNPSTRYHFSNRSEDIKRIFCESLDRLGIDWTRPSEKQIAVYRKAGVARLDEFIGPKR